MDDICILIAESFGSDDIGQRRSKEIPRKVYCTVGSISRAEFFRAGQNGLTPDMMLTVFSGDYNGEKLLAFHDGKYAIYRTFYSVSTDQVELYCKREAGIV